MRLKLRFIALFIIWNNFITSLNKKILIAPFCCDFGPCGKRMINRWGNICERNMRYISQVVRLYLGVRNTLDFICIFCYQAVEWLEMATTKTVIQPQTWKITLHCYSLPRGSSPALSNSTQSFRTVSLRRTTENSFGYIDTIWRFLKHVCDICICNWHWSWLCNVTMIRVEFLSERNSRAKLIIRNSLFSEYLLSRWKRRLSSLTILCKFWAEILWESWRWRWRSSQSRGEDSLLKRFIKSWNVIH